MSMRYVEQPASRSVRARGSHPHSRDEAGFSMLTKALAAMLARTTRTVFLAQPRPAAAASPEAWPVVLATDQAVQG
eukprot:5449540-Lingulodinium_polyedra.AAC.1